MASGAGPDANAGCAASSRGSGKKGPFGRVHSLRPGGNEARLARRSDMNPGVIAMHSVTTAR